MSIKSTRTITRAEAEQMYVDFRLEPFREQLKSKAESLGDTELENTLDEITTDYFSNYIIRDCDDCDDDCEHCDNNW